MKKYKMSVIISMLIVLLVLLIFSSCIKYKPGYVFENGTWNYVSYDTAVGRRVDPIDVKKHEFRKLKYKDFARDNDSVYFKNNKIEGSDPETFEVISTADRRSYAKDKNCVYIYIKNGWSVFRIINADPETFEVLEFPYAKDKNDAYNGTLPLFVDDVSKFEVLEGGRMSTSTSAEGFLGGATRIEKEINYNNEKYSFVKEAVIYSDEGRAKTEKLVYEGYMIVEDKR